MKIRGVKDGALVVEAGIGSFRFVQAMQDMIYHSHCIWRNLLEKDAANEVNLKKFQSIVQSRSANAMAIGTVSDVRFIFDETVWQPIEPNSYGALGMFCIKINASIEVCYIKVDFRKPITECTSLDNELGTVPVNIFKIEYIF